MNQRISKDKRTHQKRICIVATVPFVLKWFMAPHIARLKDEYDITLVASGSAEDIAGLLGGHVSFIPLKIDRKISIKNDIFSLINLWRLFRREKFDCVHSIMPKSGLLSMIAGRLANVPWCFHTFTGQVWANKKGLRRFVLKFFDKVLAMNATRVLADSKSQRLFLIENRVVKAGKIDVLADGSIAGVDVDRFKLNGDIRSQIRQSLKIPDDAVVFLFMGRLTRDKGLMDLSRAFAKVAEQKSNIHLFVVGPDEENFEIEFTNLARQFQGQVHRIGFTHCPEDYMSASDVFCLPSYREGFGTVIIEAAATGIPAIASRIYGITDAVEDGVTGILHQPTSDSEMAEAMFLLASNHDLRQRMGTAARERVINKFSETRVTKAFSDFYRKMVSTI